MIFEDLRAPSDLIPLAPLSFADVFSAIPPQKHPFGSRAGSEAGSRFFFFVGRRVILMDVLGSPCLSGVVPWLTRRRTP